MSVTHVIFLSEKAGKHPFSGAENHLWILLPALTQLGIKVKLIAIILYAGDFLEMKLSELEDQKVEVVRVYRKVFSSFLQKTFVTIQALSTVRKELKGSAGTILHIHLDEWIVPLLSIGMGIQGRVFSFHCDEPRFRNLAYHAWSKLVAPLFDRFIGISEFVSAYCVASLRLPAANVRTTYYGIPIPVITERTRAEFSIPDDKFVVGFVGRLTEQKNLFCLLEAMKTLPNAHAVIVGGGVLEDSLREFALDNQINNVQFLGPQLHAVELMPLFNLLCLPSKWEGLGLVLIEAMQLSVPVLGSRCGAIPEILGDGKFGLLMDCSTHQGLAAGLQEAIEHPEVIRRLAIAAYQSVQERFSVGRMAEQTAAVYREIK